MKGEMDGDGDGVWEAPKHAREPPLISKISGKRKPFIYCGLQLAGGDGDAPS